MKKMIDTFAKKLLTNNLLIIPIIVLIIALYPFNTQFYMLVKIIVFIFGIAAFIGLPDNMIHKMSFGKENKHNPNFDDELF